MNAIPTLSDDPSPLEAIPTTVDDHIRSSQLAVIERLRVDPAAAHSTVRTSGRIDEGLSCSVTQGRFSATMDLGPAMGGQASGPSPGFFARSGIVGCVAIGVKAAAAREGLSIKSIDVHVDTDFDDLALFGLGNSSAAPIETRVSIGFETGEDLDRMRGLVERVLESDPWFLALRDAQRTVTDVSVTPLGHEHDR